jgi:CRP-like cAMP-binding protein
LSWQGAFVEKTTVRVRFAKPRVDGDMKSIHNEILLALSADERHEVLSELELVRLKLHQVLHEPGETMKSAYLVDSGLISVLAVQPDGKSVEVGLVGKEGFIGMPLIVGFRSSPTRTITQGDGTAYRCEAGKLKEFVRRLPELAKQLHRFGQKLAMQSTQIAACNRLEERLARWIVMSQDRLLADKLPLTQEFLGQMLGTRRSSVTVAAGMLQKAGLISYTRGSVTILNRQKLEAAACDCYGIVQRQLKEWDKETK